MRESKVLLKWTGAKDMDKCEGCGCESAVLARFQVWSEVSLKAMTLEPGQRMLCPDCGKALEVGRPDVAGTEVARIAE